VSPGNSRGGPLTTDRPTAENPGEKFGSHPTPHLRQDPSRRAVTVRGVVELDLSRHADRAGDVWTDARAAVDRALRCVPAGVAVRIRLGRAKWLHDWLLDDLAELLLDVGSVEVVGGDDRGVAHAVGGLRERLEEAR
jgi:hypothetical protein